MKDIVVNTRCLLSGNVTGHQRYVSEILSRLDPKVDRIMPSNRRSLILGHLWEQVYLPLKLQGRLLFSPSNTGPLSVKRQVVTIHDVVVLDHPKWFSPLKSFWYQFLIPRLVRRVSRVITISEFSKQRLLEHVPIKEERVVVIYNGVDRRFKPQSPESLTHMQTHLGLSGRCYILSVVGTLEPRKNISRLLQAWAIIVDKLPGDIWLVLAGKERRTDLYARLSGLNNLPPRVHLTGYVSDELLPALYAGAMAFVYPSLYEGFGLPPLEAMACGTPVITSNIAPLTEVTKDSAVLVDPYDIESIASGIQRVIEDATLRKELRHKGLKHAEQFSWDRTTELTWKVLQEAAEGV